jgi:molybdopterin molybdotransferase
MLDKTSKPGPTCETQPGLMPLDDAVALALGQVAPLGAVETLPLASAAGRCAATDIFAPAAMPFFDNSAMDGFALRVGDLDAGATLPVAGTIPAGAAPMALPAGAALRIFTGAPIPVGADTVVMSESCVDTGETVQFSDMPKPGANIRRAGSDQPEGALLLGRGQRLAPRHIGLLAANGIATVAVARPPRVAVFSTGDELTRGVRGPGAIHDANRPMLLALARAAGAEAFDLAILPDDLAATTRAFVALGTKFDLVLTSGAVSVGGRDHVRDALIAAGGKLDGWRVAIKPGKPVAFGRIGATAFTGLPGNPFAAFAGFHLFVAPQIARLTGQTPRPFATTPARAGFDWARKPGRGEVVPVRLTGHDDNGTPILDRLGKSVSATLFPLAQADGLALVPAATARIAPGDLLGWQPFCTGEGLA